MNDVIQAQLHTLAAAAPEVVAKGAAAWEVSVITVAEEIFAALTLDGGKANAQRIITRIDQGLITGNAYVYGRCRCFYGYLGEAEAGVEDPSSEAIDYFAMAIKARVTQAVYGGAVKGEAIRYSGAWYDPENETYDTVLYPMDDEDEEVRDAASAQAIFRGYTPVENALMHARIREGDTPQTVELLAWMRDALTAYLALPDAVIAAYQAQLEQQRATAQATHAVAAD